MKTAPRLVLLVVALAQLASAGGPMLVGGPNYGKAGQPFTWDPATMPIKYRVDGGPLAQQGSTVVLDHQQALQRIDSAFHVWQDVPSASISFVNAGGILSTGAFSDGDVNTVAEYNDVVGSCDSGQQSPIMIDADGSIFRDLGMDIHVIAFAGPCKLDADTGYIASALAMLNGIWQDGANTSSNPEITAGQFDEAITHELGHFIGLDHSQINLTNTSIDECADDVVAGRPLMYPILMCNGRTSHGFPMLAPDDAAWVSHLYSGAAFSAAYGVISGYVYFSDGISQLQDANVIARRVDDPATPEDESLRIAVSVVSGYRFTDTPGQSVTAKYLPCNPASKCPGGYAGNVVDGSQYGSRDAMLIGYYEIPVPPGTYTVQVEPISRAFSGGSSVGPLDPPVGMQWPEFWNDDESAYDDTSVKSPVTVAVGQNVQNINFILNGTPPRFDQYEDSGQLFSPSAPLIPDVLAPRRGFREECRA